MPYPKSPFSENLNQNLICTINESSHSSSVAISNFAEIYQWLCTSPKITSIRVNTLKYDTKKILDFLNQHFRPVSSGYSFQQRYIHEKMEDVIIIEHSPRNLNKINSKEVIVDADCAAAVLRGAHIFAPGVLGMCSGCEKDDHVSIYVDLAKKCKKGLTKIYQESKFLIANGIVKMPRSELFGKNMIPRGIAVEIVETISGCPQICEDFFPRNSVLLQNLPSIICVHLLDPQPKEVILDMCAAPGHKTSHIAALMKNQGTLVAIDKTPTRIKQLTEHCINFGVQAHIFFNDSTTIFEESSGNKPENGPPYAAQSFDKILLDTPCSALGKRPQFRNDITEKVLASYVPLQKKLFNTAMNLLKSGGTLVYSTCTITLSENEGMVAWALKKYINLRLVKSKINLGSSGLEGTSLTREELQLLQRFGPSSETDSVGFFIACFIKE